MPTKSVTKLPKINNKVKQVKKQETKKVTVMPKMSTNKKETFVNTNVNNNKELLFFHADWCGHCQNFKPEWNKAKKKLDDYGIKYREIDSENPEIKNYNIRGFPTVMMVDEGKYTGKEYNGPRTAESVCKFAKDNISSNKLNNNISKKNSNNKELLFFHADWCGHCQNFKPEWNKAKKLLENDGIEYKEINSENSEIKNYNIQGFPTLMMVDKGSYNGKEYNGPRKAESVHKFAKNCISDNESNNNLNNSNNRNSKTLGFFYADWCGHCQSFKPEWEKTKIELDKHNIKYKEINSEERDLIKAFKIRGFPTLMLIEDGTTNGIEYNGPRRSEDIVKFVKQNL